VFCNTHSIFRNVFCRLFEAKKKKNANLYAILTLLLTHVLS